MSSTLKKAVPLSDSESDDDDEQVEKRIKLISQREEPGKRFAGGLVVSSDADDGINSTSASLSAAEKKGLKEVEELEHELDLKNTFSKETNRRDEDAEMNKYIDEQIRLRRETAIKERQKLDDRKPIEQSDNQLADMFALPEAATDKIDDILLHSLSKNLASSSDEKSEAMLSSQMLNGIPEVDLGIEERIRTIEATEEAKLRMAAGNNNKHTSRSVSTAPVNFSTNFQQHRHHRDARDGELKTTRSERTAKSHSEIKTVTEAVVVVGEEPDEVEYRLPSTGERHPPKGKPSDDYYLSKFKKNNRK